MAKTINEYRGYELHKYDTTNKLWIFKPRPYDDADYFTAYTEDLKSWSVVKAGSLHNTFEDMTFEEVVRYLETQNAEIEPNMVHN